MSTQTIPHKMTSHRERRGGEICIITRCICSECGEGVIDVMRGAVFDNKPQEVKERIRKEIEDSLIADLKTREDAHAVGCPLAPNHSPTERSMICEKCGGNLRPNGDCRICEMLAAQKPPRGFSDDTRFSGWTQTGGAQFKSEQVRNFYLNEARKAGVDVTGKQYYSELAAFPGDPRAWVDSQGDMRRLLEERGWSCDGDLKVKGREVERAPDIPLADDLVDDLVEQKLEQQFGPDFTTVPRRDYEDARESVIDQHAAPAHLRD